LEVGKRILALSDILEPGLSAHRGGIKILPYHPASTDMSLKVKSGEI